MTQPRLEQVLTGRDPLQVAAMAAIVTTLMCLPVWSLLALFSFGALGTSFHAFLTFGGALSAFQGVLAWWALGYLPALIYSLAMGR